MSKHSSESKGCLAALLGLFGGSSDSSDQEYPYRVRDDFLSNAEKSFYRVLQQVVADRMIIFTKVGLWEIFYVARPNENPGARNHIVQMHVDFLLCDPTSLQPVAAIELDDKSHQRKTAQERDAVKDAVFAAAGLPLERVVVSRGYDTEALASRLAPYLNNHQSQPAGYEPRSAAIKVDVEDVPMCPKCGTPMVVKVAKQGQYKGKQFYACPNYPKCNSLIPIK